MPPSYGPMFGNVSGKTGQPLNPYQMVGGYAQMPNTANPAQPLPGQYGGQPQQMMPRPMGFRPQSLLGHQMVR